MSNYNGSINWDAVEDAKGGLVSPGTKGLFKIEEVKSNLNDPNVTPNYQVKFTSMEEGTSFNHSFYMTDKAVVRMKELLKSALNTETPGSLGPDQIVTALKDKVLGLKVLGEVNAKNGKGYPTLGFAKFSTTAAKVADLSFTPSERQAIDAALVAKGNSANADAPVSAAPGLNSNAGANDDEF